MFFVRSKNEHIQKRTPQKINTTNISHAEKPTITATGNTTGCFEIFLNRARNCARSRQKSVKNAVCRHLLQDAGCRPYFTAENRNFDLAIRVLAVHAA